MTQNIGKLIISTLTKNKYLITGCSNGFYSVIPRSKFAWANFISYTDMICNFILCDENIKCRKIS